MEFSRLKGALTSDLLPESPGAGRALRPLSGALLAAAAAFLVFLPAVNNGFVSWDDQRNFLEATGYRGFGPGNLRWIFTSLDAGFFLPATRMLQALNYHFWGLFPGGYHLTSVLLHAAVSALFYLLCITAFSEERESLRLHAAALFAALAFSLHPLRAEPVAWASGTHDLLSTAFCLLAALAYFSYRRAGSAGARAGWNAASGLAFALAMLAKPSALLLPAALLCADLAFFRERLLAGGWRAAVAGKWQLLLIALPAGWSALAGHKQAASAYLFSSYGLGQRLAQAAYGAMFYLWKTVLPFGLSPLYQLDLNLAAWAWPYWPAALAFIALTGWLALLAYRGRPGPFAAWAAYLLLLAPVSGLAQTGYQVTADRYSYLATLPWFVLLAGALGRLRWRPAHFAAALAPLCALSLLSARQTGVWRDSVSLWARAVEVEPYATYSLDNYGDALADAGRVREAIPYYVRAVIVNPHFHEAHNDLATAYFETGELRRAVRHFLLAAAKPGYALPHRNLANIFLLVLNRPDAAAYHFAKLAELEPPDAGTLTMHGAALLRAGRPKEALAQFDAALKLTPKDRTAAQGRAAARELLAAGK